MCSKFTFKTQILLLLKSEQQNAKLIKQSRPDMQAKNYANVLQILISIYSSGPEKLPGLSRKGPQGPWSMDS